MSAVGACAVPFLYRHGGRRLRNLLDDASYQCKTLIEHNLLRPEANGFLFAHALIQECVYNSLLKRQRHRLHGKAAEWFEESDLVLRAEHLERAGDTRAGKAFLAAARDQHRQYRHERALSLIGRGLGLNVEHYPIWVGCFWGSGAEVPAMERALQWRIQ